MSAIVFTLRSLQGARVIADYLLDTYGPHSMAVIVDEGSAFQNHFYERLPTHLHVYNRWIQ